MKKIYTSIDIGTYSIKIIVGEYINDKLHVLASTCVKSQGLKKGLIVDANYVIEAIKNAVKEINIYKKINEDYRKYILILAGATLVVLIVSLIVALTKSKKSKKSQ